MSRKRLSFAEACPDLLNWWDFDKNTLDPYAIGPTSPKVAYWKCEHGHSFQRSVVSFTRGAHTCPVCQERKANVISKPELMKFWDFEKTPLTPKPHELKAKNMHGSNVQNAVIHGRHRFVVV